MFRRVKSIPAGKMPLTLLNESMLVTPLHPPTGVLFPKMPVIDEVKTQPVRVSMTSVSRWSYMKYSSQTSHCFQKKSRGVLNDEEMLFAKSKFHEIPF